MLKIQKCIVMFSTLLMMGYILIIPSMINYKFEYQVVVMIIGLLSWPISILNKYSFPTYSDVRFKLTKSYYFINKYLFWYLLIILLETILTAVCYNYTSLQIINVIMPYTYIFFSFPLLYIFVLDNGYDNFLSKLSAVGILMLAIRFIGWYLYNYRGSSLLQGIVLQTANWTRNGLQRVDSIPLFGIIFVFYWYKFLINPKKLRYFTAAIIMLLYLFIVTQVRYQLLVCIVVAIFMLYKKPPVKNVTFFKQVLLLLIALITLTGGITFLIDLFSINGKNGASTGIRIEAVHYFLYLMLNNHKLLTGLGMLSQWNSNSLQILDIPRQSLFYRGPQSYYYLSDLGILGCFIQFGFLSFVLYGLLFTNFFKVKKNMLFNRDNSLFLSGVLLYLILSSLLLNIFELNVSFDIPFYFAIFGYFFAQKIRNIK